MNKFIFLVQQVKLLFNVKYKIILLYMKKREFLCGTRLLVGRRNWGEAGAPRQQVGPHPSGTHGAWRQVRGILGMFRRRERMRVCVCETVSECLGERENACGLCGRQRQ